jgi:hypothetical protein
MAIPPPPLIHPSLLLTKICFNDQKSCSLKVYCTIISLILNYVSRANKTLLVMSYENGYFIIVGEIIIS